MQQTKFLPSIVRMCLHSNISRTRSLGLDGSAGGKGRDLRLGQWLNHVLKNQVLCILLLCQLLHISHSLLGLLPLGHEIALNHTPGV